VNSGFDEGCEGVSRSGQILSLLQNGQVQSYMGVIGCALIALVVLLLWGPGHDRHSLDLTSDRNTSRWRAYFACAWWRNKNLVRWSALIFGLAAFVLTLFLWHHFDSSSASLQFQERYNWISALVWSITSVLMAWDS